MTTPVEKPPTATGAGRAPVLLSTEQVSKTFGGLVAVNDVSFEIPERSIVSIIGPNGAGKTTFFNMLTGLYKPSIGRIVFDGQDISRTRPDRITTLGIARTFQNIRLFATMSGVENVMVEKRRMFWNVRAIPAFMTWSGRAPVMLLPANEIVPMVGR